MLICATLVLAGGMCNPQTRIEYLVPYVPEQFRTEVEVPARPVDTLTDVGLVLTDHIEALDTANGKIRATDCILDNAETGTDTVCFRTEEE